MWSTKKFLFSLLSVWLLSLSAETLPFADNGTLKMLYDNRAYPVAVEQDGAVFVVWRGAAGLPWIRAYDLASRSFAKPRMLLEGMGIEVNAAKYARDHHYAPVIWTDRTGHLHALFGCHGKAGVHLVSKRPGDETDWVRGEQIAESISYPKVHRLGDGGTLVYFRHKGHLGYWTYRISKDGSRDWEAPKRPLVDLDAEPQEGLLAKISGSYHTTRVSRDGKTLHVAFIWKVEEPVPNSRYDALLDDHTQRYNLYYLKVDLATGKATTYEGKELTRPVDKKMADRDCLVWDTEERVSSVGPAIYLDDEGEPFFLLPISEETPHRSWFYFVRREGLKWARTRITRTSHPFNACRLDRDADGRFRAFLVVADGDTVSDDDMDSYGWGERIEVWMSDVEGVNWKRSRDMTPVKGMKYQNVQFILRDVKTPVQDMLLFYGWKDSAGPGTGFLWDGRK